MLTLTDSIEELATLLFPPGFMGRRLILMLTAYFDESGTHSGSPIIAVAGFLAPQERWVEYAFKWSRVLEKWGLSHFHMATFENRQGPYASLGDADRIELLKSLVEIIGATVWVGIAVALVKADYAAIRDAENISFGSEYSLCANDCIRLLKKWMDEKHISERIAYVYELGALGTAELKEAFEAAYAINPDHYHLQSLHFINKTQHAQLQAADILAYETPKQAARTLGRDPRALRKSLESILHKVPCESNLLNAESLPSYVTLAREWKERHQQSERKN